MNGNPENPKSVEPSSQPGGESLHIENLVEWQKSVSQALLGLLDESTKNSVVEDILNQILRNFKALHAYIFMLDPNTHSFSCIQEVYAQGETPRIDQLQNVDIRKYNDWVATLIRREMAWGVCQRGRSFIAAPLILKQNTWGFVRIETLDRQWSPLDRERFVTVTNILGVSFALSRPESVAVQNNVFLNKLYQNMPLGYFRLRIDLDEEGRVRDYEYLDANNKFLEILGKTRDQLVGKMHTEIGPIFVNRLDLQELLKVAYEGRVYESRANQFRSNGRYYDTTIYSPQYGDVVALFNDVTESVKATNALRQTAEELQKVYTNIPVGIEVYDKDGYMIDANEQDAEIINVPGGRKALLGRSLFDHPSLPDYARNMLREGKDVAFDVNLDAMKLNRTYYDAADTQEEMLKYVTVKCTILRNEQQQAEGYLLIIIDNTELYQTSARLREFESAFNSVAEIAEVGFFRWNTMKRIYLNSDQWYKNMGLPNNGGVILSFDDYKHLVHPDDSKVLSDFLEGALAGTVKSIAYEFRIKQGDGWKWLRTGAFVTEWDPANNIVQITGINYNISEIKQAEERLREAKRKAEESDHLKSAFLANMSHEIRTPLNAIVGFSGILTQTDDPEEKKEYVQIIEKNNRHLLGLISDILDLSKIESGTMDVSISEIYPSDICNQVVSSFALRTPEGVDMRFTGEGKETGEVMYNDVKLITQVLSNFLSNAVKFTAAGHIWVGYEPKGDNIEFFVEDTGMGMTPEQAESVFERFVKVNEFIPGTGLGLSISKSITEKLGGTIGATSEQGVGSRFWMRIP